VNLEPDLVAVQLWLMEAATGVLIRSFRKAASASASVAIQRFTLLTALFG